MKTLFSILFTLFLMSNVSFATVRTVSNSPAGGAQFSNLEAAYTAAVSGDTLLIENTDIMYNLTECAAYNKSLTFIGIGFNPSKQTPKRTKIGAGPCTGLFNMNSSASGSKFYGIEFETMVRAEQFINNMVFEDCKFNSTFNIQCGGGFAAVTFRNCVFDLNNIADVVMNCNTINMTGTFSNCVFDGYIDGANSPLATMTIEHCLFLSTNQVPFNNLLYATIKNNIFMNVFPGGTTNSTYENNICRVAGTFPPLPGQGNTGSGNISNTNPLLVNCPISTNYGASQDYHLQAGSPAIGTASDLTDIGIHGGTSGFSEQGEVLINPIIRSMSIVNSTVASNGTLNVQLHATKPDND